VKRRAFFLNLTLLFGSGALAFLGVETMVRLTGVTGDYGRLSTYEFDPELGWKTRKEFRYFQSTAAYGHFTYWNQDGLPTDEAGQNRALSPDAPSIALLGDSFVEGYYLPYEQTFVHLLDQKLTAKQIVNLGVSGYSPDQYLLSARAHLRRFNVTDVVVMLFSGNDLRFLDSDRTQGVAKPVFGERFDKPINTPLASPRDAPDRRVGLLQRVEDLADRSATFRIVKPVIGRLLRLGGYAGTFTQVPVLHGEADMRKALGLIKQIQIEFPVERFLVYFVPVMEEIEAGEPFERNVELFDRVCAEMGLRCYSLERIVEKGVAAEQIFTPGEGHFSARGSALVADDLFEILMSAAP
jgi:hypothetical protein